MCDDAIIIIDGGLATPLASLPLSIMSIAPRFCVCRYLAVEYECIGQVLVLFQRVNYSL